MSKNMDTRLRLGRQLRKARKSRGLRLQDLARRTGKNPARISELETGKANSTIESLEEIGVAVGMTLMFIPDDRRRSVEILIGATEATASHYPVTSVFDEVFIDDSEDEQSDDADH